MAPLIQRECLTCHIEGGIGPFLLDDYDAVSDAADLVVDAVMVGYMPPWMPDRECREFAHQRGLSVAEREVIRRWRDGGLLRGDPADSPDPPEPPPALETTDIARMVEPYTPSAERPDDYRCFLMDLEFPTQKFMTGRSVVPGANSLVHHVLSYAITPAQVAAVEAADAADPGPGYTCFGGPIPEDENNTASLGLIGLGGWVPGALPFLERDGRAVWIPAGSRIVMQVHYNLLSNDPEPDSTEMHLQLTDEEPDFLATSFPTAILELDIPAGAPSAMHRQVFRNYTNAPMNLTAFTPHMHMLGRTIGLQMVPPIGEAGEPTCLVDVPDWNFNWQQSYAVREDDPIELAPGAGLELTCVYDNSASHQPVVNGEQLEPRDVTWGEGSLDEMCLLYVQHEVPWTGPIRGGCEVANDCLDSCATNDTECLFACENVGGGCRACVLRSTLGCARDACLSTYVPAATCLPSCINSYALLGGTFDRCMQAECPTAWAAVQSCVAGIVDAGTCDEQLTGCGLTR
ncbi:MAG TPA: hypothetical protein ENK57_12520 [Polyangiaceae bacterium]|nr:hypothetical protein [Polyangiaceae bacterium]